VPSIDELSGCRRADEPGPSDHENLQQALRNAMDG
jgi:hypothetical protein